MSTASKTAKHKESGDNEIAASRLLLAAFDSSESVRFIVQEDGKVLHFNRKAYENSILIHQKELKKGDNLFDYASDTVNNVQTKLRSELKRTFKGESFTTDTEVKYDHRSRWFQTEYIPIFENKKIVAASISTYEITQKKLHDMQLAETIFEVRSSNQHRGKAHQGYHHRHSNLFGNRHQETDQGPLLAARGTEAKDQRLAETALRCDQKNGILYLWITATVCVLKKGIRVLSKL
jgi:hypothetical protein